METTLDALARKLGLTADAIRHANLVPPEAMPYRNLVGKVFDSGDYPEALRRAVAAVDVAAIRARQAHGRGASASASPSSASRARMAPASTTAGASPSCRASSRRRRASRPDGVLELRVGLHSHGQGLETTLAQVAHEILGVDPARVRVVHGDTALTPYSTGTWGSRAMVMAGGAVAEACRLLRRARHRHRRRAAAGRTGRGRAARRRGACRRGAGHARPGRPDLVPQPAEPARRRRPRRAGGDGRLPPRPRHRHPQLCRACRGGGGGYRDRDGDAGGLRHRRGWRHAGEPDDRRRPGARRHRAGHRHRAV